MRKDSWPGWRSREEFQRSGGNCCKDWRGCWMWGWEQTEDGGMDGWMNGLVGGWVGGLMGWWVDEWGGWMDGWVVGS